MKLLEVSIGAVVAAGVVLGTTSLPLVKGWQVGSTDNAYVRGDVMPVSPKITGYIADIAVSDNQKVSSGQILYRIQDDEYRARVAAAQAVVAGKRAVLSNLKSRLGVQHANVVQVEAAIKGAQAEAERAEKDFQRIESLARSGTTTLAALDAARFSHLNAQAKLSQVAANLVAARAEISVLENQRPQLLADTEGAEAALQLAQIDLENTAVRAPSDGTVGERQVKIGQFVRPGTSLIPFVGRQRWIIANFKEIQLPDLHVGAEVKVSIDAVPDVTLTGTIESISPASGAQFALLPPDNATGNFTKVVQRLPVRIAFSEGQERLGELLPGMSAIVTLTKQ